MTTLLAVIFVFGLLIIGHELGHFIVAKLSGIKIMEFSFGMGPRLLKFGRGETEYSWRIFPVGGFVKMLGEEEQVDDPRSFSCKPTAVRMAVLAAGPVMNILIAVAVFSVFAIFLGYAKPIVAELPEPQPSEAAVEYPAKAAGILPGDKIIKANGRRIFTYEDFTIFMLENGGETINLVVERQGQKRDIKITPVLDQVENRYMIGITPVVKRANLVEGISYGFLKSYSFARQIVGFFKNLLLGRASTDDVSGPVGIIKYTGDAAKHGFDSLLYFTAFLSLNLAVLNLLPFPALDGGWLFILLIEAVRRKKIDGDKIGLVNFIGFAFLMLITVLVTFRDIIRLDLF